MGENNDVWSKFYKKQKRILDIQTVILWASVIAILVCIPLGIIYFQWVIESDLPDWLKWLLLR